MTLRGLIFDADCWPSCACFIAICSAAIPFFSSSSSWAGRPAKQLKSQTVFTSLVNKLCLQDTHCMYFRCILVIRGCCHDLIRKYCLDCIAIISIANYLANILLPFSLLAYLSLSVYLPDSLFVHPLIHSSVSYLPLSCWLPHSPAPFVCTSEATI